MNYAEIRSIADAGLNAACAEIQTRLGVQTGDAAGLHFSGETYEKAVAMLADYINLELRLQREEKERYDQEAHIDKYTIKVSTSRCRGFFEHDDEGMDAGGGLWFEVSDQSGEGDTGRKLALTDYDGVFELPKDVIAALEQFKIIVSEDFK